MSKPHPNRRLFHYTIGRHLPDIIASETILLADQCAREGTRPAAWFSLHQDWEETANKGTLPNGRGRLDRAGTLRHGRGLARIEVDPEAAPHNWGRFCALAGVSASHAKELAATGRKWGANPRDWRVSFDAVTSEHWLAIEVNHGAGWVRFAGWRPAGAA
jgi:hypothetical protein